MTAQERRFSDVGSAVAPVNSLRIGRIDEIQSPKLEPQGRISRIVVTKKKSSDNNVSTSQEGGLQRLSTQSVNAYSDNNDERPLRRQKSDNLLNLRKSSLVRDISQSHISLQRNSLNHSKLEVPKVLRAIHQS